MLDNSIRWPISFQYTSRPTLIADNLGSCKRGGLGASGYHFRYLDLLIMLGLAMASSGRYDVLNAYQCDQEMPSEGRIGSSRTPRTLSQNHSRPMYHRLTTPEIIHTSVCSTIFSLSGFLGTWPFLLCFLSFSTLLFKAASSSALISPAFFTCFGNLLCLWILRISGMCLYRSFNASSYSSFCLCRALLIPERVFAFARQSRTLPSSDPDW